MSKLKFTTYSDSGDKYIVIFQEKEGTITWSSHFKVEATADDRGIKSNGSEEMSLFTPLVNV